MTRARRLIASPAFCFRHPLLAAKLVFKLLRVTSPREKRRPKFSGLCCMARFTRLALACTISWMRNKWRWPTPIRSSRRGSTLAPCVFKGAVKKNGECELRVPMCSTMNQQTWSEVLRRPAERSRVVGKSRRCSQGRRSGPRDRSVIPFGSTKSRPAKRGATSQPNARSFASTERGGYSAANAESALGRAKRCSNGAQSPFLRGGLPKREITPADRTTPRQGNEGDYNAAITLGRDYVALRGPRPATEDRGRSSLLGDKPDGDPLPSVLPLPSAERDRCWRPASDAEASFGPGPRR